MCKSFSYFWCWFSYNLHDVLHEVSINYTNNESTQSMDVAKEPKEHELKPHSCTQDVTESTTKGEIAQNKMLE